ncbi:MAG: hypothetical protein RXO43_03170 [Candidatus Micrarchaeota archaeon]
MLEDKFLIKGSITLGGEAKCSMAKVKERMAFYPHLKLISEGSELEYMLVESGEDVNKKAYTLKLSRSGITLYIYSNLSTEYFERESLLRLFSLAQLLSDLYVFDISSIFPNLLHFLYNAEEHAIKVERIGPWDKERGVAVLLSKKVIALANEVDKLSKELLLYKDKVSDLLAEIIGFNGNVDKAELAKRYNLDMQIIEKAFQKANEARLSRRLIK